MSEDNHLRGFDSHPLRSTMLRGGAKRLGTRLQNEFQQVRLLSPLFQAPERRKAVRVRFSRPFFLSKGLQTLNLHRLLRYNHHFVILHCQQNNLTATDLASQDNISQGIIDIGLDRSAQWTSAILFVEAFL